MGNSTTFETCYRGLRMTADEYLILGETPQRYELIDGVVSMSPSASLGHQRIITEIAVQIGEFLKKHPIGTVAVEVDVRFGDELVYRPDLIFLTSGEAARCGQHVTVVPSVIVEVVWPDSRSLDSRQKRADYQRLGVREYWLIDPLRRQCRFLRASDGHRFEDVTVSAQRFASTAIKGFTLDLAPVHALFEPRGKPRRRRSSRRAADDQ